MTSRAKDSDDDGDDVVAANAAAGGGADAGRGGGVVDDDLAALLDLDFRPAAVDEESVLNESNTVESNTNVSEYNFRHISESNTYYVRPFVCC